MKKNIILRFAVLIIIFAWAMFDVMRDWFTWSAYMNDFVNKYFGDWHIVKAIEQICMLSIGFFLFWIYKDISTVIRKILFIVLFVFLKWSSFELAAHILVPDYSNPPHPLLYLSSIMGCVIFSISAIIFLRICDG